MVTKAVASQFNLATISIAGRCVECGGRLDTVTSTSNDMGRPLVGEIRICVGCVVRLLVKAAIACNYSRGREADGYPGGATVWMDDISKAAGRCSECGGQGCPSCEGSKWYDRKRLIRGRRRVAVGGVVLVRSSSREKARGGGVPRP